MDNWPDKFYEKIFSKLPKSFGQLILIIMAFTKNFQIFENTRDQILISSGMDGSISHIFNFLTKPGDNVGVLSPTYAMYYVYSKIFRCKLFKFENYKNLKLQFDSDLKLF